MKRTIGTIGGIAMLLAASLAPSAGACAQRPTTVYSLPGANGRGWLGVSVQDVTKKLAESRKLKASAGAYVSDVSDGSPAEKAGILEGDVIVKFDGRSIDDRDELMSAVRRSGPGDEVTVVVDRMGETKTLTATLDEPATPRAMTFTVPGLPAIAPPGRLPFGMTYYRSGERLGMEMQTLGKQLGEFLEVPGNRGVLVSSVDRKGAGAAAGMKAGDVIVRVNRNGVRDVDDVLTEIREAERDTLPFEVVRKGKAVTLTVAVGQERDDTSELLDGGMRREWRVFEELRGRDKEELFDEDLSRGLEESIRDLKRDLERGARDLEREFRRSFRES
jgi:serine protease Do